MKSKRTRGNNALYLALFIFVILAPIFKAQASIGGISETRGIHVFAEDKASGQKKEVKLYHKSYAVIIGIDQYENLKFDQQLSYAVRDAKGVEKVLKKNFKFDKIITLYNDKATKDNIMKVLSGDMSKLSKNDSVFVFWAGHGYTEKTDFGDLGYLLPFDGNFQESELYKNISMTMIKDDISKRIPAKHIFFVMDSCYSGLLATRGGESRKSSRDFRYLQEITKEQVRQVLTAGSKDQQVLDGGPKGHSVFTGRFIELLENTEDFVTASEISTWIKERVFSDAKARNHIQTPKSGRLFGMGDYVFVPSLEQKVEDTKAKIGGLQKELQRLEELGKAAAKADDERIMRQAELDKRMIQAKLKAEQLRQQALEEDRHKREQEERERLRREKELAKTKKAEDTRLAALTKQVREKRKDLGDVSLSSLSPQTTIIEMRETDKKIKGIKGNFRKELAEGIKRIADRVNDKFVKLAKAKQDEFETEVEFKARIEKERKAVGKEQTDEIVVLEKKINSEYNLQIIPFIENLKKLSGNEFTLTADKLILELHEYNAKFNTYPVTIRVKHPINGILVGSSASANIPIPRQEARTFKQHFENNMLRPEISGNFQTNEFFRITRAYIIDDATNKKYDLFSSKFVDFGGIVYDNVTKSLWLKNANYFGKMLHFNDAQKACENLDFAGLTGWHLPAATDLERIYPAYHKQEPHPFNNFFEEWDGYYWSKTRGCKSESRPHIRVDLSERRRVCYSSATKKGGIWPVHRRDTGNIKTKLLKQYNLFASKFVDLGNGIVYDSVTKLLWLKNANYFGKRMKFNDAQKTCENLVFVGLTGWRFPNVTGLERMYTVYHEQEPHPFNNFSYNYRDSLYWSETLLCKRREPHIRVDLSDRKRFCRCEYTNGGFIWPVRGAKWTPIVAKKAKTVKKAKKFPAAVGYVSDFAKVLSARTKNTLSSLLKELERKTQAEVAIAILPDLGRYDLESYAIKLFKEWELGKKGRDKGLLILLGFKERKVRIEVGHGLENIITDGLAGEIIQTKMVPFFRRGNYDSGLLKAANFIADTIKACCKKYNNRQINHRIMHGKPL